MAQAREEWLWVNSGCDCSGIMPSPLQTSPKCILLTLRQKNEGFCNIMVYYKLYYAFLNEITFFKVIHNRTSVQLCTRAVVLRCFLKYYLCHKFSSIVKLLQIPFTSPAGAFLCKNHFHAFIFHNTFDFYCSSLTFLYSFM